MRKNFQEILKSAKIDLCYEYHRLYTLFYEKKIGFDDEMFRRLYSTLHDIINSKFRLVSFRNNALDLDDFDRVNGFTFSENHSNVDIDLFLTFCEYLTNIINDIKGHLPYEFFELCDLIDHQIDVVIEQIGYMEFEKDELISYVPKNAAAIAVAEIIENDELSYNTIFYNHHSLKNNLESKKSILLKYANLIESRKTEAKGFCDTLLDNISYAMNNFNIRHNNIEITSKAYKKPFATLSASEKENLYDATYQLCLEFFLALDNKNTFDIFTKLKKQEAK